MHGYVICELEKVKEYFPEYGAMMKALEVTLVAQAVSAWRMPYGGIYPKSGEFGKTTIMPELFQGPIRTAGLLTSPLTNLPTWRSWYGSTQTIPGHNTIMQGNAGQGAMAEDYKIGLAGIAFLDKVIRIDEVKMQIGDRKLPRINIEEAMAYNKPAIIFEDAYILDEEESYHLYAHIMTQGPQRTKLIGLQLNRVPNKLQATNTGTTLT